MTTPLLLPMPRRLIPAQGALALKGRHHIRIQDRSGLHPRLAEWIRHDLLRELHLEADVLPPGDLKPSAATFVLVVEPSIPPQGYRLHISERQATLSFADEAGGFHGTRTIRQLVRQFREALPACDIDDAPDFPDRGVMIDISRDKVPTLDTLMRTVDMLADLKFNHLELYTEHTFAYRNHRVVWQDASPMTADEIREIDAFCRDRHIELVPNQNCFGHLDRWLRHKEYADLAEAPDGFTTPWGERRAKPFSLNPLDPRSLELVTDLLRELLPNFASRRVNVGCDETFDLGQGRSREACERDGKGRVYLDYLLKLHAAVTAHKRTMMFWGDIVLHHPDLIPDLPRDIVPLVWGYEADHPFDEQCGRFAATGLPFLVCPGTSTWNSIGGRTKTALANLALAAEAGRRRGASGYMVTDWGDNGHWQPFVISLLPYAAAAQHAWCSASFDDASLAARLDMQVMRDEGGAMGSLLYDLGAVHDELAHPIHNASALFRLMSQVSIDNLREAIPPDRMRRAKERLDELLARLDDVVIRRDDAALLIHEVEAAIRLMHCALDRGLGIGDVKRSADLRDAIAHYRRQWIARNRPGGLDDSLSTLQKRSIPSSSSHSSS